MNRCAHRGVKLCRHEFGNTRFFVCPYHQWSYDATGALRGVPFIKGVNQLGGMPEDFERTDYALPRLIIVARATASSSRRSQHELPSLETYLGEVNTQYFDRVFDGRALKLLGYSRQLIPGNWKLMFENIKDPYHASLLHVFLVTFGLFRADQKSQVRMDSDRAPRAADLAARRSEGERRHARHLEPARGFRAAGQTPARSGEGVSRRRNGGDADDLAESDRAAAVEHARAAADPAARSRVRSNCTGRSSATPTTTKR